MPRASILLPTHNRADVVGAAIASALLQTETDWELLVVGDGCTDGTAALVEGLGDPRVRWFDLPKGPGFGYANRNVALREARGDLVAFLAHDDLWLPDHLALMLALFERPQVRWAHSRPLWLDEEGWAVPFFVNLQAASAMRSFRTRRNVLPAVAVAFRRELLDAVGLWPEDVDEAGDWEMWRRMIEVAGEAAVGVLRQPTALHFRAAWRAGGRWGPEPLAVLSAMAREAGRAWPPGLRLPPRPGDDRPLQHQVLDRLQAEPAGLPARLRHSVALLQDQIAWAASHGPLSAP